MRVVVDGAPLFPYAPGMGPSGVGRWTTQTFAHLASLCPDWRIEFVDCSWKTHLAPDVSWMGPNVCFHMIKLPNVVYTKFKALRLLPPIDLIGGPVDAVIGSAFIPWRARKAAEIPVIHDLSYRHFPETVSWKNLLYLRANVAAVARRAARVATVSHSVADEIHRHLKVPRDRISVVPNGCDPIVAEKDGGASAVRTLPDRFVLFVGTLEPRKNLQRVLRAHRMLTEKGADIPPLLIAGGRGWRSASLERDLAAAEGTHVHALGYVEEAFLAELYRKAEVLVFPSLYEGFGLPIVEAMKAGTPVITSDRGAMREVAGDAAVLVDPEDESAIALAIHAVLSDTEKQRRLSRAGIERAEAFTWDRSAAALREAIEQATSDSARRRDR